MLKETLQQLVDKDYSLSKIATFSGKSKTTIRYWLNKYKLKTHVPQSCKNYHYYEKKCLICGENDPKNFYNKMRSKCKKCFNVDMINKQIEQKKKIIQHMGEKCCKCGYDRYYGALEVHHLFPSKKDINFKNIRGWSWKRIKKELKNCILLCSNCHSEVHGGVIIF